ncbi:hypothetical protein [Mycolicibacterium duvalii]|uniref:Lipoprotein LpqE n=1 Tax=Mycolicibacterium duvalii TaxID=39688 RepID=A0A7I7K5I3_9MYCO|nr:hypothetical protein [Mycolicibacterium duvalii]BBX18749.1 hypothetical protein MDUV_36090 [Mycolicibacterium duvalii]
MINEIRTATAGAGRRRTPGLALVGAALLAVTATGCGDEVIGSSTNRGSGSETEETTVENAFIVPTFMPGYCAIQVGSGAQMRFTVTNNSSDSVDRLTEISTSAANIVDIGSGVEIPRRSTVAFGQPSAEAVDTGTERPAVQMSELSPDLKPAMTTDVTFRFDRAGEITVPVPVEACPRGDEPGPEIGGG